MVWADENPISEGREKGGKLWLFFYKGFVGIISRKWDKMSSGQFLWFPSLRREGNTINLSLNSSKNNKKKNHSPEIFLFKNKIK